MTQVTEYLFSYGTLQQDNVQMATFGRKLEGQADSLPEYTLSMVEIDNPDVVATSGAAFHPILRRSGHASESVKGMVFQVSREEIAHADRYEVKAYKRVALKLASGIEAWVYVDAKD
jgi:gamma-glutamylcyclotransferase (GGCT)/AIG2-like uncharacterized protein YtfP